MTITSQRADPQRRRHRHALRHPRRRQAAPAAAKFQFRAHNEWISGTHSRATSTTSSASARSAPRAEFVFDADHPAVLVGKDNGPTPVEYVLHALAACLTAGMANIAAARGVTLTEVRSTVGRRHRPQRHPRARPGVRNGYQQVGVQFAVKGDAPPEVLARSSSSRVSARPSSTSSPTACR